MNSFTVIKHGGKRQSEAFNSDKLHASVEAACLSVRCPEGEACMIAGSVVSVVNSWCQQRSAVTAQDIRRVASRFLNHLHPDAAYLYENHQLVI